MAASQGQHAQVLPGMLVQSRYLVIKEIGCGNFSKVYTCKDTKAPSYCAARPEETPTQALKVLKREYANDAAFERDMLKVLASKDPENKADVSKMQDVFHWNRHPCFVMPLKGPTLRSRKMGLSKGNVSRNDIARLAQSLLKTMKFVHFDCKMVHTDLKPENILLNADANHLGDGWTICDFGSASHWRVDRMDSDLISTRPYRAPEVVMGNPWSYPADMWSLGCILFEAALGYRLFEVHDDSTHLHLMAARLGALPDVFTKKSKHTKKFFDAQGGFLRPNATSSSKSIREILKDEPLLLDLLENMLHYDPLKRLRADVALDHPFLSEAGGSQQLAKRIPPSSASSSCGGASDAESSQTPTPRKVPAVPVAKQEAPVRSVPTTISTAANKMHNNKFRALPPLVNAFQALGIHDDVLGEAPQTAKENMNTKENSTANKDVDGVKVRISPSSAAAQRPVQGKCRTPEELRRAPLSAHVGSVAKQLAFQQVSNKLPLSGVPRSSSSGSLTAGIRAAVPVAAGKSSGVRYFGR